ncbi:MAG: hypothetical protein ACE5H9_19515, partial [Anaerolineae bacterium]
MNNTFLHHLAGRLTHLLPHPVRQAKIRTYAGKNSVRLYFPELDSSHYEVCLRGDAIEIAFTFTGGRVKNSSRLALFESHLYALRQDLQHPLDVCPNWRNHWARVAIQLPKEPLTEKLAEQCAELTIKFLDLTYPILRSVFEAIPARSSQPVEPVPVLNPHHFGAYAILSRRLDRIRAFLQGRAERPPDDVLCDWVQLCYTFELFKEGAEIFSLIDPATVQPWLYERTRRLAKICRIRAT